MNTDLHNKNDNDFETACELSDKKFSHSELISMLKNGNIPQKQFAAFSLDEISSQEELNILLSNLTGCDGKIREAVALKINNLLKVNADYPDYIYPPEIFADATVDINGNICRLVVESVKILMRNNNFSDLYLKKIIRFINETFVELDNFIYKDKKYVINKQLFKLYWCLEALKLFVDIIDKESLFEILTRAAQEKEYTIREKVAQILVLVHNEKFNELKNTLKNDENYYVRVVFNS